MNNILRNTLDRNKAGTHTWLIELQREEYKDLIQTEEMEYLQWREK